MQVIREAHAGTMESGDAFVTVEPAPDRIIAIESPVLQPYGRQIEQAAVAMLDQLQVEGCRMLIRDKGALDYVLRARVETALRRGSEEVIA